MTHKDHISHQYISGDSNAQVMGDGNASVSVTNYHYHYPTDPQQAIIDATLVEAAQILLSSMPLEIIPKRSPLPPGSYMPLSSNPLFLGRDKYLKTLATLIKNDEATAVNHREIIALTGIGGIGKTQLMCEFIHRYGRYFKGGVFWLNFAHKDTISSEIVKSFDFTNLASHTNFLSLPLEEQIHLILSIWQNPLPRLLIFDNCEDEDTLNQWCPKTGASRVLITTRRQVWPLELEVTPLRVDVLERQESINLLNTYRPDIASNELDPIAHELGDLPLALSLAGGFLRTYKQAKLGVPKLYLEQLQKVQILKHPSLQGKGSTISPTSHDLNVERTFALSYKELV